MEYIFFYTMSYIGGAFCILVIIILFYFAYLIIFKKKTPRRWVHEKIDNYLTKNNSEKVILRDLVKLEIERRIIEALKINDNLRDIQEKSKLKNQADKFFVQENGWCAELSVMEEKMKDVYLFRDEILNIRKQLSEWAEALDSITSKNESVGGKIVTSVGSNLGELEKIALQVKGIKELVKNTEIKHEAAMRIKIEAPL